MSEGNEENEKKKYSRNVAAIRSSSEQSFDVSLLEPSPDIESKVGASTRSHNTRKRDIGNALESSQSLELADATAPPSSAHASRQLQQPGAFAAPGRGEGERPVWEHRPPPRSQEEAQSGSEIETSHSRSRSIVASILFRSSLAEASPVDAEAVVYATSVSTEEKQKQRRIYMIVFAVLVTAIVVGTVVGVVVFTQTVTGEEVEDVCSKSRRNMTARMQCKCFEEIKIHVEDEGLLTEWKHAKDDFHDALSNVSVLEFDFNHTECIIKNKAIWTLLEGETGKKFKQQVKSHPNPVALLSNAYAGATFYVAFDGDNWSRNDRWFTHERPCTWFGVECSIAGHVSGFYMANNNLRGNITSGIFWPERLRELVLGDNAINGTLPAHLFRLTSLKVLDLRNNDLTGLLPESYEVDVLNVLDLSNNSISGTLPSFFQNMTRLRKLSLNKNQLTGPIPTTIGLMTSLEHFEVAYNGLNGTIPSSLKGLVYLEIFNVRNNSITGTIPSGIDQLSNIYFIDLSINQLSGSVPRAFTNCDVSDFVDTILLDCVDFGIDTNSTGYVNGTCTTMQRGSTERCCVCTSTFRANDDISA